MLVQRVNSGSCKFHVTCVHKMADTSKTAAASTADRREAITERAIRPLEPREILTQCRVDLIKVRVSKRSFPDKAEISIV